MSVGDGLLSGQSAGAGNCEGKNSFMRAWNSGVGRMEFRSESSIKRL